MANSIYEATGDGSTTDFTIPYTYLEANDVTAFIGGVSTPFTFTSNNIVSFATAPANGASLRIVRNTDIDSLNVTYSDGGALTAEQLNDSNTQLLFGVQEAIDTANEAMILDNDGKFQGQASSINRVIKNIADPTNAQDVATKNYVDTGSNSQLNQATQEAANAAASATASANSATASAASESAASTSETNAATSASTATTQATNSSNSATASANSATASATSATASANSATAAASSATDAQGSEDEAEEWATKTNGIVASTGYSAKAWSIGGTGVTSTAGAGAAQEWASNTTTSVDGTEYAAKEYSIGTGQNTGMNTGSAKQWSLGGGASFDRDTAVTGSGLTAEYSAKYWANQAANSAKDFVDVYYGSFTSDSAAENYQLNTNQGSVNVGDLYFDSANNVMRVRSFSGWNDVAADTTNFATKGFAIALAIAL